MQFDRNHRVRLVASRSLIGLQAGLALANGYLLALLVAASRARKKPRDADPAEGGVPSRLVVLVPAHNEQGGIGETLQAVLACGYPRGSRRIVAIADNCTDATAARASELDVEVWERREPDRRGKGHALTWASRRLAGERTGFDAVVVLDADCIASANLLTVVDRRLRGGASAVQVDYVVGNPHASRSSALRFAGFALMNTIRARGKDRLGLSCGLAGTGMAFSRELLEREPWTETGLTEDAEYHLRLVAAGERVEFAAEASVSSAMPTTLAASADQQARWESGKLHLIRRWSARLICGGLRERDPVSLHAGLECLVPPQSLIAAGSLGFGLAGLILRSSRLVVMSGATLGAQLAFVLGGLRLVGAPEEVYRALLSAPALIGSKLWIYGRIVGGKGPTGWIRTERAGDGHEGRGGE